MSDTGIPGTYVDSLMLIEIREPFPPENWPLVWSWMQPFLRRVADDFGPKDLGAFVERSQDVAARARTFAVYRDGELGGLVVFEQVNPISGNAHVVFRKSFWGAKITQPAMREVVRRIFESRVLKIQGLVFANNNAVKAAIGKLGFRSEGLLRSQTLQDGRPIDVMIFGLLKEEFSATPSASLGEFTPVGKVLKIGNAEDPGATFLEPRSEGPSG